MASQLPVPEITADAGTPSPPGSTSQFSDFQGKTGFAFLSEEPPPDDPDTLSPRAAIAFARGGTNGTFPAAPGTVSGASSTVWSPPGTAGLSADTNDTTTTPRSPFNFQTVQYTANEGVRPSGLGKSHVGQRRGHKYKHSSVSHQIFLEPVPKAPLQLPASLPLPTFKECRRSMTREQRYRTLWCFCHLLVAANVLWGARESLAMTAVSRLLFFDALSAFICVGVDIGSNFEVWNRSSIRHPFGLERADVLAGFGSSVLLGFMGLDLVSHSLQHALEGLGNHEAHHSHAHDGDSRPGAIVLDADVLLAIGTTFISAVLLKNHARIGRAIRGKETGIRGNPSHMLTLISSCVLLSEPLLPSMEVYTIFDRSIAFLIACVMISLGFRMGAKLGTMLLMSYSDSDGVRNVMREIEADNSILEVQDARFWQVHYGLCMANLQLRVKATVASSDDALKRFRERITSLIRDRLGGRDEGGMGKGLRWETSIQVTVDHN